MNKLKQHQLTIWLVVIFVTIFIWHLLYKAQFLEYDANYANLILAFIISIICLIFMFLLAIINLAKYQKYKWQIIFQLIMSGPWTVVIIIINYVSIFGASFKL